MKILILIIITISLFSCTEKDSDYVYNYDPVPTRDNSNTGNGNIYNLKVLGIDNKVDVLFVVDNSGSMGSIQDNIIDNSKLFMNEFIKQEQIDWKLGVISTDSSESAYLGFDKVFGTPSIDYTDPVSIEEAVQDFQKAISRLGTSGSASEYVFYNVMRFFKKYNGSTRLEDRFIRDTSHLAVIMVTDEKEQSQRRYGLDYEPFKFLENIKPYVHNRKKIRFYGALQRTDLEGCTTAGDSTPYVGSSYQKIIDASGGFNISACLSNFGLRLADIGKDIAALVRAPGIALRGDPKVHTIRVMYKDNELCPGPKEDGGMWYYDNDTQSINFYSFNFVDDMENDFLKIDFDIKDGIPRDSDPDNDTRSTCGG